MFLIKDICGNYFDAEKVDYFKVRGYDYDDGASYDVEALTIIGKGLYTGGAVHVKYTVSQHDTEEAAREYLGALVNTIRINGTKR